MQKTSYDIMDSYSELSS